MATETKDLHSDCKSKALGLKWNVSQDNFYFDVQPSVQESVTRRKMLSSVSSLYDPLGLLSPVLIVGKIIFQDATRLALGWDAEVPYDMRSSWASWTRSLQEVACIEVPRCIKTYPFDDGYFELHHFSDASLRAYGCCSYLRCINRYGDIKVSFLCSKGRVAPLKSMTIPRLELQAALQAARMDAMLREELHLDLGRSWFWTDSEVVLKYIANDSKRFHIFVANRVAEINSLSDPDQWSHVSGSINPADIISRGMSSQNLIKSEWFSGPKFLHLPKSEWPVSKNKCTPELTDDDVEVKRKVGMSCHAINVQEHPLELLSNHYSDWNKLKRSVGWLLRLKNILLKRPCDCTKLLSVQEVAEAELVLVKHVQKQAFPDDFKLISGGKSFKSASQLRGLSPFINEDDVLCVGGRLGRASIGVRSRHPYIIPFQHPIATLIVRNLH